MSRVRSSPKRATSLPEGPRNPSAEYWEKQAMTLVKPRPAAAEAPKPKPAAKSAAQKSEPARPPEAPKDERAITTFRVSPEGLEALKIVAAIRRVKVNDLLLEGAERVLAEYGRPMQLRRK